MKKIINSLLILMLCGLSTYSQIVLNTQSGINYVCNGVPCSYTGPSILINEVMMCPALNDGSIYGTGQGWNPGDNEGEWIELYNPDICKSIDISCFFLGNNTNEATPAVFYDLKAGFSIPPGTVVPPAGFVIIRGINAIPVDPSLLIANGGNTIEIVLDPTMASRICLLGQRFWFPNVGGWFAFYDRNGVPQDAISWNSPTACYQDSTPCNPATADCPYTGNLSSYTNIPAANKTYITASNPGTFPGQSWRRMPDGGAWSTSAAAPTMGTCNDTCAADAQISCNGTATVIPSGGNPPYTYLWDDTQASTNATATGLCAGIYTVTVTDALLNTATISVQVFNAQLYPTMSSTNLNCYNDNSGSASVDITGGTIPYTYTWNNSATTQSISNLSAGNYSVTIIDRYECDTLASVIITQPPEVLSTCSSLPDSCGIGIGSAAVVASGGTGPYSYIWSPTGQTTATASGLMSGPYNVTITDANGCIATNSVVVASTGYLIANAGTDQSYCIGGSSNLNASGGIIYQWSPTTGLSDPNIANPVANPTTTTTYYVTVSDAGCSGADDVTVTVNSLPVIDAGLPQTICNGASTTITATGGSTYIWGGGETTNPIIVSPTSITTYTVTGTDANGCTGSTSVVVDIITIGATADSIDAHCGHSDGSATVYPAGTCNQGWTYLWGTNPPQTTQTAVNLPSTTYIVTVSCGACTTTASVMVGNLPNPSVSITSITPTTCGYANGGATATATGGDAPYTYSWSNGQSGQDLTNVVSGTYNVTVTDAFGCNAFNNVTISGPLGPSASTTSNPETCQMVNGSANVTASGGTAPYTYIWNNDSTATDSTYSGITAGTYTVVTTDANGCTTTTSVTVHEIPGPLADFYPHPRVHTILDSPVVTLTDNSSGTVVNWGWDFGDGSTNGSGEIINHNYYDIGTYVVTLYITDANGCKDTTTDTIKVIDVFTFYVPNAFTPNDDGFNDFFFPDGVNWDPNYYEFYIFDRWGNLIFETTTIGEKWNGTVNNNRESDDAFVDVYVYLIRVKELEGPKHEYIGRVTLTR